MHNPEILSPAIHQKLHRQNEEKFASKMERGRSERARQTPSEKRVWRKKERGGLDDKVRGEFKR